METAYREEGIAATLGTNRKHCHACAMVLDVRAAMCPRCGVPQAGLAQASAMGAPASSSRNRMAAALLALFLGGIGIHKFYLGRSGMGILYLLFCWTLIPTIIAFIEGIVLLTQSDQTFARAHPDR